MTRAVQNDVSLLLGGEIASAENRRYLVVRGVTGAGAAGMAAVALLVATEPVGAAWRGHAAMAAAAISAAGAALLPGLGWALPWWRGETFAAAAVTAVFLVALLPSVPESPRWLLLRGRKVHLIGLPGVKVLHVSLLCS